MQKPSGLEDCYLYLCTFFEQKWAKINIINVDFLRIGHEFKTY